MRQRINTTVYLARSDLALLASVENVSNHFAWLVDADVKRCDPLGPAPHVVSTGADRKSISLAPWLVEAMDARRGNVTRPDYLLLLLRRSAQAAAAKSVDLPANLPARTPGAADRIPARTPGAEGCLPGEQGGIPGLPGVQLGALDALDAICAQLVKHGGASSYCAARPIRVLLYAREFVKHEISILRQVPFGESAWLLFGIERARGLPRSPLPLAFVQGALASGLQVLRAAIPHPVHITPTVYCLPTQEGRERGYVLRLVVSPTCPLPPPIPRPVPRPGLDPWARFMAEMMIDAHMEQATKAQMAAWLADGA